jgi:3-oxoacyl-[acyl-carrier-protein] synthase II
MGAAGARIAVTGVGIVSALGPDASTTFRRLAGAERGFRQVTLFDVAGQRSELAAEITELRVQDVAPRGEAAAWSRSDALAVLAARDALGSAGLQAGSGPLALAIGGTTGGMYEAEAALLASAHSEVSEVAARRLVSYPLSASADRLAETLGPFERVVTLCSACSSGANAIMQAIAWLRLGHAARVLACGTDALSRLTFVGFNALGATDPAACRPFDAARAGLTLGEGAGFVVLELEPDAVRRGATVLAWLTGWAGGAEAHHITNPEPSGHRATQLLRQALDRAGLLPQDVDYVNAHGTGTLHNDAMEAGALSAALQADIERVWVSSSKGQLGHTLGAAGAIEAALTVLAIHREIAPPTGGLTEPDPRLPLRYVRDRAERVQIRAALSNSFGFGGSDTVLLFECAAAHEHRSSPTPRIRVVVSAAVGPAAAPDRLEPARSRRFDRSATLVTAGAEHALRASVLSPSDVGLVVGTTFGNVERSVRFLRRLVERGPRMVPPAEFPHLLPSAPAGNASVYLGLRGPVLSVADVASPADAAVCVAKELLELGLAPAMVAGSAVVHDPVVARVLAPLFGDSQPHEVDSSAWLLLETDQGAQARQAPILAEVALAAQCGAPKGASLAVRLNAPVDPTRALVVYRGDERRLARLLSGVSWDQVARRDVAGLRERYAGTDPLPVAAGARLVADAVADEVLVCAFAADRVTAVHLVRAERG